MEVESSQKKIEGSYSRKSQEVLQDPKPKRRRGRPRKKLILESSSDESSAALEVEADCMEEPSEKKSKQTAVEDNASSTENETSIFSNKEISGEELERMKNCNVVIVKDDAVTWPQTGITDQYINPKIEIDDFLDI